MQRKIISEMEILAQCNDSRINVSSILNFFQFVLKCDMLCDRVSNDVGGMRREELIELNAKTHAAPR